MGVVGDLWAATALLFFHTTRCRSPLEWVLQLRPKNPLYFTLQCQIQTLPFYRQNPRDLLHFLLSSCFFFANRRQPRGPDNNGGAPGAKTPSLVDQDPFNRGSKWNLSNPNLKALMPTDALQIAKGKSVATKIQPLKDGVYFFFQNIQKLPLHPLFFTYIGSTKALTPKREEKSKMPLTNGLQK